MLLSCVTISFWSRASSHMQIKPTGELQGKWDSVVATYFVLFLLPNGLITGSNCLDGTHCMSAWLGSLFAVHLSLVCNPAATYACLSVFFSRTLFRTHIYFCLCTFLPIPLSCWFSLSASSLSSLLTSECRSLCFWWGSQQWGQLRLYSDPNAQE